MTNKRGRPTKPKRGRKRKQNSSQGLNEIHEIMDSSQTAKMAKGEKEKLRKKLLENRSKRKETPREKAARLENQRRKYFEAKTLRQSEKRQVLLEAIDESAEVRKIFRDQEDYEMLLDTEDTDLTEDAFDAESIKNSNQTFEPLNAIPENSTYGPLAKSIQKLMESQTSDKITEEKVLISSMSQISLKGDDGSQASEQIFFQEEEKFDMEKLSQEEQDIIHHELMLEAASDDVLEIYNNLRKVPIYPLEKAFPDTNIEVPTTFHAISGFLNRYHEENGNHEGYVAPQNSQNSEYSESDDYYEDTNTQDITQNDDMDISYDDSEGGGIEIPPFTIAEADNLQTELAAEIYGRELPDFDFFKILKNCDSMDPASQSIGPSVVRDLSSEIEFSIWANGLAKFRGFSCWEEFRHYLESVRKNRDYIKDLDAMYRIIF